MKRKNYAGFYDWEFELICTRQRHDVKLWKKLATKYGGPILDICCGTGRITQELAKMGFEITALDNSPEMLEILEKKKLPKVQTVLADMRDFSLDRKFKFAFISYSSFQQLLSLEDQAKCLNTIKRHLTDDGVLGIDINPHVLEGSDVQEKEISYIADFPARNSRVTMFTSHKIDLKNQIKHWEDTYVEIYPDGRKNEFINRESLKGCNRDDMQLLFEKCGYNIIDVFGDFDGGEMTEDSWNMVWVVS
ncbi:MAG: class I SAM-dependent methyltransferase [Candidatus Cloacimonadales bacterium]|nr:class I SAM-dependent methyltransferase [Candidatus Cloacimonadales bacterium]